MKTEEAKLRRLLVTRKYSRTRLITFIVLTIILGTLGYSLFSNSNNSLWDIYLGAFFGYSSQLCFLLFILSLAVYIGTWLWYPIKGIFTE